MRSYQSVVVGVLAGVGDRPAEADGVAQHRGVRGADRGDHQVRRVEGDGHGPGVVGVVDLGLVVVTVRPEDEVLDPHRVGGNGDGQGPGVGGAPGQAAGVVHVGVVQR